MNGKNLIKMAVALLLTLWGSQAQLKAQLIPPDPYYELDSWGFDDTNWASDLGFAPVSFSNLNNPPSFDGNCLQVDSTNAAWLQYNIQESDGTNELEFEFGTIELWVLADWNSGTGPGDWGRLIDVGAYSTNNPSSWWSLYFTPDGSTINFSSATNGVFTNYLSVPIAWDTNTWHFLALTYDHAHSQLYVDGQLATNGAGVFYRPSAEVVSKGFFVGSDPTGRAQARSQIDAMATYNYVLSADDITNDYAAGMQLILPGGFHPTDGDPIAPGGGGGGTNNDEFTNSFVPIDYGTNLYLAVEGDSNNALSLLLTNTTADILFEIQGCTNLAQGMWFSEGFVDGPEITNCAPFTAFTSKQGNLFLRIRSWVDDTGTGIPDWWWSQYFGDITNVNAYAEDPVGDGYSDLQKFQLGLNPLFYYNPNPPPGFFGAVDASGTNAFLEWSSAPGPVLNYAIQRGIQDTNGNYVYSQIGLVSSNAVYFEDVGAITNANAQNNVYNLTAVYPGGSLSATDTWEVSWYVNAYINDGDYTPPNGPPVPGNVYTYAVAGSTNVLISWSPVGFGATNFIIGRFAYDTNSGGYDYAQIATTNADFYLDVGVLNDTNAWNDYYAIEAVFPGNIVSQPGYSSDITATPPAPANFAGVVDATGTNVLLSWTLVPGIMATNYTIVQGVLNTNTSSYSFTQIASLSGGATSYTIAGAITGNNSYNNIYEIESIYSGNNAAQAEYYDLPGPPPVPKDNIYVTASLIRNGTGRWQIMFSGLPTNSAQVIQLAWTDTNGNLSVQGISTTNLSEGVYPIADTNVINRLGDSLTVQLFGPEGEPGQIAPAGILADDAPYFVDGRQHMKQNLNFLIRGASLSHPFFGQLTLFSFYGAGLFFDNYAGEFNQTATNFEEFSFLHHGSTPDFPPTESFGYFALDNLWPFKINDDLANYFVNTSLTNTTSTNGGPFGLASFNFQPDFATDIPAPASLAHADPYWILQPGFDPTENTDTTANWAVTVDSGLTNASLASGLNNLYGLPDQTGCEVDIQNAGGSVYNVNCLYQNLPPGGSVTAHPDYFISGYASWCPAPTLELVNYYFAPLSNPNLNLANLPGETTNYVSRIAQPFPLPIDDDFAVTNQTPPLIIGTVGQPMILGGWAKYAISNTSPAKFAYLGQYFATNPFVLNSSGVATTNSAGILSPYGEFFPLQGGQAALVTMPDIDTGLQATSVVDVISLNVDGNHDGTLDLTYAGPDQTSVSRPFRFWVNDNQDSGDDGGNFGVPGIGYPDADGVCETFHDLHDVPYYNVHGRRDLVDFFPVYLNIGSLFQSNALSAGISVSDTNYVVGVSQADGALRFAYTGLTATNYMSFLQDTNVSGSLASASLITIPGGAGVALRPSFLEGIATNNQGIILVEAWESTTNPLVLTIYHGTNQIAQTQLPLSISGVEQMFRSKTMLLKPLDGSVPDRLTDASVPNEPDTTDANFVFLHGYNVLPQEARGVDSDVFKRMYWAGSHAKFWAVTWEGADTKIGSLLTPNYHTNVVNAFLTAPLLANFIATLTNAGPVVVAAHSLGNMVTLSAISDWDAPISQYFMVDAAVPIEAVDFSGVTNMMVFSTWTDYSNRLFASDWYQLFPTNDARSTLFWNNRVGNLRNVDVYNFYSTGEEVLRTYLGDPPPDMFSLPVGTIGLQVVNHLFFGTPFGTGTWYWQEKGKGTCQQNWFLGSTSGGWGLNQQYGTNVVNAYTGLSTFVPRSAASSAALTSTELETNAFFSLYGDDAALQGSDGSTYAQTYRDQLLADSIPAMSEVAGANPIPLFSPPKSPVERNIDMMTLENTWSAIRTGNEANKWHHSDFQQMAYTFTYKLYVQFVTTGNLK